MARLAVRADQPLPDLQGIPGPVILGEPALWTDGTDDWHVFSDPRIAPEQVGRAAAIGQGKPYTNPGPPPDVDTDPYEWQIEGQGQQGRRPVTVRVDAEGLRPKPTEETPGV